MRDMSASNPVDCMKYVVVTGGVLSGLGKGITASSIGVLLKSAGLRLTSVKIDPYLIAMLEPCRHSSTVKYSFSMMEEKLT